MVGAFVYPIPMMRYNASSWLIAAGADCQNLGSGLCWDGCWIAMWASSSSSWVILKIDAWYPLGGT